MKFNRMQIAFLREKGYSEEEISLKESLLGKNTASLQDLAEELGDGHELLAASPIKDARKRKNGETVEEINLPQGIFIRILRKDGSLKRLFLKDEKPRLP